MRSAKGGHARQVSIDLSCKDLSSAGCGVRHLCRTHAMGPLVTYGHACGSAPGTCRPPGRAARWCSLASRAPTAQWFASSVVRPRTAPSGTRITVAVRSSQPTFHTPKLQAGGAAGTHALPRVTGALRLSGDTDIAGPRGSEPRWKPSRHVHYARSSTPRSSPALFAPLQLRAREERRVVPARTTRETRNHRDHGKALELKREKG